MADTYLPADVRKRIVDVMRERKMTQRELALRIDVNESTISRFLSGKTEKLSEESVIRIARVFNVSTVVSVSKGSSFTSSPSIGTGKLNTIFFIQLPSFLFSGNISIRSIKAFINSFCSASVAEW